MNLPQCRSKLNEAISPLISSFPVLKIINPNAANSNLVLIVKLNLKEFDLRKRKKKTFPFQIYLNI